MGAVTRVLPEQPYASLAEYRAAGGGRGIEVARKLGPASVVDEIEAAGLRGRGGGGFPTGVKWRTVAGHASAALPATVVVNGAEGEPGTFKDRTLLRATPYAVVEGALIAALAVGADRAVVALKATFEVERVRLEAALAEVTAGTDWADGVNLGVATGPSEYLFGEETALLEVLDGRPPFPRIAPPFRHGVDEVGPRPDQPAGTVMAEPGATVAPPTLANNVETMANVPLLIAEGADWFRSVGTRESPGTVLCTVTGATRNHGVAEVALGTPLAEALELIGGGPVEGRRLVAAMSGVANPPVLAERFDTPLTYEDMQRIGTGLGACGFLVFDDSTDMAAVGAGVARFLAVESCGQCTPCKQDGRAIAEALFRLCAGEGAGEDPGVVADRVATVADRARCFLAHQQERVVGGILVQFPDALARHLDPSTPPVTPEPIVPIRDIVGGRAELDLHQLDKQPDWTFEPTDSGQAPADRMGAGRP
ncbi:MAG TPA: NADH-ubiquinone oxidoreductase-F iron-sulfur binding region domain-containing protein [Acidimicrobiales bacterium]|nr:NADH-ubiquinone oxidoreductase-F iron-sulfur binding region domain-containing protein [Acidimicrobiales bacterium]